MSDAFEHHIAMTNGVKLHFVTAGSGDPVVLLHGWPETWYQWRKIMPALAERYTVIAPDLRGFGDSGKPVDGYDKRTVAEDVHQLVHHLGFERIFLVGHDIGGPTAYAYAAAHQGAVRGLVLLDVSISTEEAEAAAFFTRLFHLSFHAEPDIAVSLVTGRERTYLSHFYRRCYNPGAFSEADIDEYVARYSAPGALRGSMAHYGAIWTDLAHQRESARTPLEMPVLALGGSHGFGHRVLESCRKLARDVRGGVIDRCGHFIAEERPEELTQELLAFFADVAAGEAG